ncbi:hypothetical protein HGRIS_007026 [Hohenbuehelia grisea]|uniref:DNA polymerase alpha subunit B n=1 Tax=Hohenbuehelia grisea TaxID=104357 RepID=A0ABR3JAS9_9AGAR
MDSTKMRKEIIARFGNSLDEKILEECIKLCRIHALTAEDLYYKMEALQFSATSAAARFSEVQRTLDMDALTAIRAQLERELAKEQAKKKTTNFAAMRGRQGRGPMMGLRGMGLANPPVRGGGTQVMKDNMRARQQGTVGAQVKLEPGLSAGPSGASGVGATDAFVDVGTSSVVFRGPKTDEDSKNKRGYKYMFEKITERSEALDDRIDEFARLVQDYYGIQELGDPGATTDESVYVVGRVVQDADAASTVSVHVKLSEATICLESSRMMGSGGRVPLRFDPSLKVRVAGRREGKEREGQAYNAGLFPGMIVALKGKNGGGGWFAVEEILSLPPLKPSSVVKAEGSSDSGFAPFSMLVAAGPYTADADLQFKPWKALLGKIKASKPDVVVLLGPFIDSTHPLIQAGDVDLSPSQLFKREFTDPLSEFLNASSNSVAVIVPSVKDIVSSRAVFPQAELSSAEVGLKGIRLHLVPNPCRFSVNGISFGAESVDVLFHLKKEELVLRGSTSHWIPPPADGSFPPAKDENMMDVDGAAAPLATSDAVTPSVDAMSQLCRHVLHQRSFYPVFPVPVDLMHEVNLDVSHGTGLRLDDDPEGIIVKTEAADTKERGLLGLRVLMSKAKVASDRPSGEGTAPDVLILPSRLKHFVKTVEGTVAVNPSFLSKGTFAMMTVASRGPDGIAVEVPKLDG